MHKDRAERWTHGWRYSEHGADAKARVRVQNVQASLFGHRICGSVECARSLWSHDASFVRHNNESNLITLGSF